MPSIQKKKNTFEDTCNLNTGYIIKTKKYMITIYPKKLKPLGAVGLGLM